MTDLDRSELRVRRADDDDVEQILELAARSLGWNRTAENEAFFRWKHFENPAGRSPMWVAVDDERIVGLRAFLRWELRAGDGTAMHAVRAVDTATDPEYQGRGIFTRLTLHAIDELRASGVPLIFNTPNAKSLPGYLKMGWTELGRLPVTVRLKRPTSLHVLPGARGAASRLGIETEIGEAPGTVFAERERSRGSCTPARLTGSRRSARSSTSDGDMDTSRLAIGSCSGRPLPRMGSLFFRMRHRGRAVEGVICDVLTPDPDPSSRRALLRSLARTATSDYLLRIDRSVTTHDGYIRLPFAGPVLTCRRLDADPVPRLRDWRLNLGDVELF